MMRNFANLQVEESDASSDNEAVDATEYEPRFDSHCNQRVSDRGFGKLCTQGLDDDILRANGWQRKKTGGANSIIYTKLNSYLKICKGHDATFAVNTFCKMMSTRMVDIRSLQKTLGQHAPRIQFLQVCPWNTKPYLVMMMQDAGIVHTPMPYVKDEQIVAAAYEMADCNVFSSDLITDSGHVNTGNLAFRLTPGGRKLKVAFLDLDDVSQYCWIDEKGLRRELTQRRLKKETHDDVFDMVDVWIFVIRTCLHRTDGLSLDLNEYATITKHFIKMF